MFFLGLYNVKVDKLSFQVLTVRIEVYRSFE